MEERKVVRFQLENGEWRSKVYILNPDTNQYEEGVKQETKQPLQTAMNFDSVWSKPKYDTNRFESYIHYLVGIERGSYISKENKILFNKKINVSWGKLQPELTSEEHKFAAEAHTYSPEKLIDTLKNDNATKNIERLSNMSREEVEEEYISTNRLALSNRDNIEQRVNNAFLKGEGLEDITINGKVYQGLLFDENSKQSQRLNKNSTFQTYYDNYRNCMKEIISEIGNTKEIDTEAISQKLSSKLGKPNFSKKGEVFFHDYYGLMGGTQNIEIDFKITPASNGEYNLKTTMNINDWYGADADDINSHTDLEEAIGMINYADLTPDPTDSFSTRYLYYKEFNSNKKGFIPGLDDFFWLQHHYGCEPFPTQIIYKSEDKIKLGN